MLKSMTAFACAETTDAVATVNVEIRTYNSRHLDTMVRLPHGFSALEEKVKAHLAAFLVRGRVEARLKITDDRQAEQLYDVDVTKAISYAKAAGKICQALDIKRPLPIESVVGVPGVIVPADNKAAIEDYWPAIRHGLDAALEQLQQMREKEGRFLGKDLSGRLDTIEDHLRQIETAADGLINHYRDRLTQRIEALTDGLVELDPARIAQEAAILADRSDISEEITRARSHVQQFRSIMAGPEPAGRKLNFLLQEFNREFNTMGSKIGKADVAHLVVDVKAEIEKLREQVQNIE